MFENIDPDLPMDKEEYHKVMPELKIRLGELQRTCRDQGIPVMIVVEGWRVSGISDSINRLTSALDARGYRVYPVQEPVDEERSRPLLWRFWVHAPKKGTIAIFDRSWYSRTLLERFDIDREKAVGHEALYDITTLENQLADDGTLLVKFFLHISRKEQKKRWEKLKKSHPELITRSKGSQGRLKDYDTATPVIEDLIQQTDTKKSPWTIVEANDREYAVTKIYRTIISAIEERISVPDKPKPEPTKNKAVKAKPPAQSFSVLAGVDLNKSLSVEEYETRIEVCRKTLKELQYGIFTHTIPVIIVFEGWDAAGKGGAIIRLDQALNPRCSVVEPISAPTEEEKNRHYLWRFHTRFPKHGHITVFDRSWYGRVLVERVEGFCTEEEWQRAYDEINAMEANLVNSGAVLVKFWMHIDKDIQIQRFKEREADVHKQYKITEEDWRNREKWDLYESAVNDMLEKTSTPAAPWTIVESDNKHYARIKVLDTVIEALDTQISANKKKQKKK